MMTVYITFLIDMLVKCLSIYATVDFEKKKEHVRGSLNERELGFYPEAA